MACLMVGIIIYFFAVQQLTLTVYEMLTAKFSRLRYCEL